MPDAGELERRTVEVNDPAYSDDVNRRLTEAVREVIGTDSVLVPVDRPRVSQGEQAPGGPFDRITHTKAVAVGMVAVGVLVGLIVALTGGHWWLTGVVFAVLGVALAVVVMTILGLSSTTDYPDPGLVAILSEQGIRDPEVRFSEIIHEFTPVDDDEDRDTPVEEDPAQASAEQRTSVTPSGGPSEAVGPGS